jgi:hypothetical protein
MERLRLEARIRDDLLDSNPDVAGGYLIIVAAVPENDGCQEVAALATVGSLILRIRRNMMTRWIVPFGCVLALTVVAFSNDAEARYSRKKCNPPDKAQSFVCSASEKCCYDYVLRKGACTRDRCF